MKRTVIFIINIFGLRYINRGKNNKLIYNNTSRFNSSKIIIKDNNNQVIFGNNCKICGLNILVIGENNVIKNLIDVLINASKYQPTIINAVGGKKIGIGDESFRFC